MTPPLTDLVPIPGRRTERTPRILELDLSRGVVTSPPTTPMEAWQRRNAPTVRAVRDGLRRAATDPSVAGLVVHVGAAPLGLAEADEVGALIAAFGEHKPTLAWAETFGELDSGLAGYRLAVRAGEVWIQESGAVGVTGVLLGITLLRGGLDKLGLDPEFGQRHEYKSAADQLSASEVTPANREMMQRIADSLLDDTVALVARRREMTPEAVRAAVDRAPLAATEALDVGLVDRIGYRDEVLDHARQTWTDGEDAELLYVQRYAKESVAGQVRTLADRHRSEIAVVDVNGPIVRGGGRPGQAASDVVSTRLREAGRQDRVRAVVLRVDSPGGSYVASDTIRREVIRLRESGRPVVAQMGTVAASGGYFVAMPADEIVAQPTTLTGSIGVLAGKIVTERLLQRVGLVHEQIHAGARAAMMASTSRFTDDQRAALDAWLDLVYADFTTKAATDRGMPIDELEPLARGRVWTGVDAHERGLVDHLGGSARALERACALADLDPERTHVASPPPWNILRELRPAASSEAETGMQSLQSTGAPTSLLETAARLVGVPLPHGVLSLPWDLRVG